MMKSTLILVLILVLFWLQTGQGRRFRLPMDQKRPTPSSLTSADVEEIQARLRGPGTQTRLRGPGTQTKVRGPETQTGFRGPGTQTKVQGPETQTGFRGPGTQTKVQGPETQTGLRSPGTQTGPSGSGVDSAVVVALRRRRSVPDPQCGLRSVLLQVRDLGLGYDSDESVLFKYCGGACPHARSNHDLTLTNLLLSGVLPPPAPGELWHHAPCCRPTHHEDMAFLDNSHRWHKVEQLSAADCSCVG